MAEVIGHLFGETPDRVGRDEAVNGRDEAVGLNPGQGVFAGLFLALANHLQGVADGDVAVHLLNITGEIGVGLYKLGMGPGQIREALAGPGFQGRHIPGRSGPALRIPAEPLELLLFAGQLDGRITVVLGVVVVVHPLNLPIGEGGINHLGIYLVHRGQRPLLLQEKERRGPAQSVETRKGGGGIEVSHHLRTANLVITVRVFLNGDKGIGQQVRPLQLLVLNHHINAVGGILAVAFIVKDRVLVHAHQGIQVRVTEGIAGKLEVPAEKAYTPGAPEEIHLGGVTGNAQAVGGRAQRVGRCGRAQRVGRSGRLRLGLQGLRLRLIFRLLRPLPLEIRVVLDGFFGRFCRSLGRFPTVFHHRVSGNIAEAFLRILDPGLRDVAAADSAGQQQIGPHIYRVAPVILFRDGHHRRLTGHANLGKGVGVLHAPGQGIGVARGVHQFHLAQHLHIVEGPLVEKGIGPGLLVPGEQVHIAAEEKEFLPALVPAVVGRQHLVVLPHVGAEAEISRGKVAAVLQAGGLHKSGVHVHVHLVVEDKKMGLGVVCAVQALDNLPVFVPHGRSILENRHGVLGVVVQETGA